MTKRVPGVVVLSGPFRAAVADALQREHGAKVVRVAGKIPYLTDPLRAFAFLTGCLRWTLGFDAPLVAWDASPGELLANLPKDVAADVKRPVVRVLNRLSGISGVCRDLDASGHAARLAGYLEAHRAEQLPAALDPKLQNFGGHAGMAEFLLVGDRVNPSRPEPGWPFFGFTNSSQHLSRALEAATLAEGRLCFVNMHDERGPELVRAALDHNPRLHPVVLGSDARATFDRLGLDRRSTGHGRPAVYLHHPQFYRRFHAHDGLLARELRLMAEVLGQPQSAPVVAP